MYHLTSKQFGNWTKCPISKCLTYFDRKKIKKTRPIEFRTYQKQYNTRHVRSSGLVCRILAQDCVLQILLEKTRARLKLKIMLKSLRTNPVIPTVLENRYQNVNKLQ